MPQLKAYKKKKNLNVINIEIVRVYIIIVLKCNNSCMKDFQIISMKM